MEFHSATLSQRTRPQADALVVPFYFTKDKVHHALKEPSEITAYLSAPVESGDFRGKEGEITIIYSLDLPEKRVILLGLGDGDKITVEKIRRAYGALAKACMAKKMAALNFLIPHLPKIEPKNVVRGMSEGFLIANYTFLGQKNFPKTEDKPQPIKKIHWVGADKSLLAIAQKYLTIFEGVYLARDLINGNADDITPQHLVHVAKDLSKKCPSLKTTVFDKKRIEKEKMGLLLAVNRGSNLDPAFIIISYKGDPKSKDHTVVIGKGITFDTGGLNLKPTGSMETMRYDMSGAATVLGTLYNAAKLKLKCNVTGVIATTENSIGSHSFKPGDVYVGYSGKSVEIGNTDAEGRLVLADAIAYAVENLQPTRMIDFATLTGAIDIAIGPEACGLFSNDDKLSASLQHAGTETFERSWRFPLFEEYREYLKSEVADLKSTGGRSAGSITAATFLKEFAKDTPWAHFDIASTAFFAEGKRYYPKLGAGTGIRTMIEFLENL